MKAKLSQNALKVNVYEVLRRAIEEGTEYGYMRAYKHTDTPDEDTIKNEIVQGIMNSICEYFVFDDFEE